MKSAIYYTFIEMRVVHKQNFNKSARYSRSIYQISTRGHCSKHEFDS